MKRKVLFVGGGASSLAFAQTLMDCHNVHIVESESVPDNVSITVPDVPNITFDVAHCQYDWNVEPIKVKAKNNTKFYDHYYKCKRRK